MILGSSCLYEIPGMILLDPETYFSIQRQQTTKRKHSAIEVRKNRRGGTKGQTVCHFSLSLARTKSVTFVVFVS